MAINRRVRPRDGNVNEPTTCDVYGRVAEALKAIGTSRRVQLLITMSEGEWTPIKIDDELGWPRGTASRQLGCLRSCGLVSPSGFSYYVLTGKGRRVHDAIRNLMRDWGRDL